MEFDHSTDSILPDDQAVITIGGTGGITIPSGTTAQRAGTTGTMRWNTETTALEILNSSSVWQSSTSLGISQLGKYKSVTNNQAASDPGAGKLKWNNATQSSSTAIYIDSVTDGGFDATNYFNAVKVPVFLYIQDMDDASIFQRWTVTSIVDSTGWFTFSVTYVDGAGSFGNNKNIIITLVSNSANGTVTSVAVSSNGTYSGAITVGSSPITTSGTITLTPNVFGAAAPGIVPLSGGGTTNFLRADGTWAAPGGGGATNLGYTASTRVLTSDTGTDVTLPLFTSTEAGLTPLSGGGTTNFLRADGTWAALPTQMGTTNLGYTASTRVLTSDTGTDVTLPLFTSTDAGLAPLSGGGTTNFLRADGTWAAPTASAAPAGNNKEVQYNNAGTTAGAANVEIDNGDLCLVINASPVTPPADNVKMFGKKLAQRMLPASVGPAGLDSVLQPATWRQKIGIWTPPGNATTVPGVVGTTAWTAVGTATARNVATTNLLTRMRRLGYVSAATAGSLTSIRTGVAQYTTGTGAGLGGFFASFRFAITDVAAVSGARFFAGFSSNTAAPTNAEPSTLTNVFGVAQLSTSSTQLYFVYGGSAAQTAVALGTGFPPMASAGIANGVPYDLTLFCPPSGNGVVHYELFRLDTNTSIAGTITPGTPGTQTPANTTLLNPVMWRCNNATALAVGMDLCNFYVETDY